MTKASALLSPEQKLQVERAIADAEAATSAEIMVVLATRSGRYDRAEDLFGLLLALIAVSASWFLWQDLRPDTSDWVNGDSLGVGLWAILAMTVFWSILGAALATWFPVLASPFISRAHKEAEARRRGFEAFHLFRVGDTADRHGLLIYVSLLERMAWVVGDRAINEKLPAATWESASRAIAEGFARRSATAGLVEAVALCGRALAEHFPQPAGITGQGLSNTVHFMD